MIKLLAQRLIISTAPEQAGRQVPAFEIEGPLKNIEKIADLVNIILQFVYPFAAIVLFFQIVWGGYDLLLSQGSPERIEAGKKRITFALLGFIFLVLSFLAVRFISRVFGLADFF